MPAASSISPHPVEAAAAEPPARPVGDPLARPLPGRVDRVLEWLAGAPLVPPAIGLIAGIWLDAAWHLPLPVCILLCLACGVGIFLGRRRDAWRHFAVLLAGLAVGAPLHDLAFRHWPNDHLVRYSGDAPTVVRLTSTVLSTPQVRAASQGAPRVIDRRGEAHSAWFEQVPHTRLLLEAESAVSGGGRVTVSGTVIVLVREPVLHVSAGDRVELFGSLHRVAPPSNPGAIDWALKHRRNGILVGMSCEHAANVVPLAGGAAGARWLDRFRQRARAAMLDDTFAGELPGAQLLASLVLGQRSAVDQGLNDDFVATGTVHYLSVSGAHVGMLAGVIWVIGLLLALPRRWIALLAAVVITLYAALAEPNAPIMRSMIMGDVLCIGVLARRPVRSANWLALSALILLAIGPTQLFEAGFQLSFLSLLALIYLGGRTRLIVLHVMRRLRGVTDPLLAPEVQRQFHPGRLRQLGWSVEWAVASSIGLSIPAWAVSVLLGAYHFRQVSFWGWMNTLLVLPLVWLALVFGLFKAALAAVWGPLGIVLAAPLAVTTDLLIGLVRLLARLPGSWINTPVVPAWLPAMGLLLMILLAVRGPLRLPRHGLRLAWLTFALAAAVRLAPSGASGELHVQVLAVGDGTACLVQLPNGKTLLYDIGSRPPYDLHRWTVGPAMAAAGLYGLDAAIISHPDLDHFSGLPDLLARRHMGEVFIAPQFVALAGRSWPARRLLAEIERNGVPRGLLVRGDRLSGTGEASVEVLWPPPLEDLEGRQIERSNDTSLVLRIAYAGRRVLLCGDIEEQAQRGLLASADLRADVLIAPHHGGVTPCTPAFLAAVDPRFAVRSTGRSSGSARGLPAALGCRWFNTADDGAVEIRIGPDGLDVKPWQMDKGAMQGKP